MAHISKITKTEGSNTSQAIWVAIGSFSSFSMSILTAAILSRYFDKVEYGTYRQILYVYNTLLIVFSAGLPNVFSYFLPRFKLTEGKDIVWKITKILLLAGAVFSFFLFAFSGVISSLLKNPDLSYGLKVFSVVPFFLLPTLGIEGIFSTYRKTVFIAIYNTLTRLLMLICIVLPVILLDGNYLYAIYGWIGISIISFLIALYFKNIPFKNVEKQKSNLTYKEIFRYSIPLATASLWGIVIRSSNEFYISRYFGTEVFAVFTNGFIELPFVGMVTMAASTVLMPMFSKMIYDETNIEEIIRLWKSALLKSAMVIYPIVVFFLANARTIVTLLYSESYADSAKYFQIAMMLNFFNIIIFAPILLALGKTKFYSYVHLLIAIFIWIFEYFIVMLTKNPLNIAIASVVANILKIIIFSFYVSRLFKVQIKHLYPFVKIFTLTFQSAIVVWFTKLICQLFSVGEFINLLISFLIFGTLVLSTGKLFNLDYLILIKNKKTEYYLKKLFGK